MTYNVRDVITENPGLAGSFPQKLERHPPVGLIFHQPPKTVGAKPTNPLPQDQAVNYLQCHSEKVNCQFNFIPFAFFENNLHKVYIEENLPP